MAAQSKRSKNFDKEACGGYFTAMKTVGLEALKDNLSEYVRAAAAGEIVRITDGGAVVAQIGPALPGSSLKGVLVAAIEKSPPGDDAHGEIKSRLEEEPWLAAAIRDGRIRPPIRRTPLNQSFEGVQVSLEQILLDLEKDRADR